MRASMAFFKKEWRESIANYHVVILVILFSLFSLMSVFTAKFTPQLIELLVSEELAKAIPVPTQLDVWLQFFKNIGQLGIVIAIILFSGTLTNEYSKGTLTLLVTKGLPRWKILMTKWKMSILLFSLSYLLGIVITWFYSKIYFEDMPIPHLGYALFILWLFVLFLMSLIIFASVLFKSSYMVLLLVGGVSAVLLALNLIPNLKKINPINLWLSSSGLIQNSVTVSELTVPVVVTLGLIILFNLLSIFLFNKKSI